MLPAKQLTAGPNWLTSVWIPTEHLRIFLTSYVDSSPSCCHFQQKMGRWHRIPGKAFHHVWYPLWLGTSVSYVNVKVPSQKRWSFRTSIMLRGSNLQRKKKNNPFYSERLGEGEHLNATSSSFNWLYVSEKHSFLLVKQSFLWSNYLTVRRI